MKEYIRIEDHPQTSNIKDFIHESDKVVGQAILDVDGHYYFWFINKTEGAWSSYILREIADKLDMINKPYVDRVNAYFESEISNI